MITRRFECSPFNIIQIKAVNLLLSGIYLIFNFIIFLYEVENAIKIVQKE